MGSTMSPLSDLSWFRDATPGFYYCAYNIQQEKIVLFTRNNSYFSQSEEMNGMDVTMFILFSWLPYLNAERTTTETSRAIKYGLYVPYLSEIALAS